MPESGIQWSSTNGHMQVGIEVRWSTIGANTTQVDIWIDYWAKVISYGMDDNQTLRLTGWSNGSTYDYHMYAPYGGTVSKLVKTRKIDNAPVGYSGNNSYDFGVNLDGAYDGSNPSKTYNWTIPNRPASAPGAPNVSWSGITKDSVVVSCSTPPSNGSTITDYDIQVDNNSNFSSPVTTYTGRGTTVSGLAPGTRYYLRARAQNSVGESTWGATEYFTTSADVPNTAGSPTFSSVTDTSATISYATPGNNGSSIIGYDVQLAKNSGFTSGVINLRDWSSPAYPSGLTPATRYYVRVRAENSVGNGNWSSTRDFTTGSTPPSVPTSVSIGSIDQTDLTVSWGVPSNSGGTAVTSYRVLLATNSAFTQNVKSFDTTSRSKLFTGLRSDIIYYAKVRANNAAGSGDYSATQSSATLDATPVITYPFQDASATSSQGYPRVTLSSEGLDSNSDIQVQFSQSGTFASDVTTVTYHVVGYSTSSSYTIEDESVYLKTGTWYARAKAIQTDSSRETPWSSTRTFLQSHTPSALTSSPTGGDVAQYQSDVEFTFGFNDSAGAKDNQTAYHLVVEVSSDGTSVVDTGKTALTTVPPNTISSVTAAISDVYKNVELRWRVMLWDVGDTPSAWSGYGLFTLAEEPSVTVSSPAEGVVLLSGAPTISWSSVFSLSATQASAQISIMESSSSEIVFVGDVTGEIFSITPDSVVLSNLNDYFAIVEVTDSNNVIGSDTVNFSTEYEAPDPIEYNTDSSEIDTAGYLRIDWYGAVADDTFAAWRVYRRKLESTGWTLITRIADESIREYYDYMIKAGDNYIYSVTQTAIRSGEIVESPVGYRLDGSSTVTENRSEIVNVSTYWIIDPMENANSVYLPGVNSDNSVLEFETATYTIIGRGRHRDYGDELGYSGQLECKIRGLDRPNDTRLAIEKLRRTNRTYYLRTPFGRLFPVALGNLSWTPLTGTGTAEMGDLSIPYEEVR